MTALRRIATLVLAAGLTLAVAAPASAGTASVTAGGQFRYIAGASEANRLVVNVDGGGNATVQDAGNVIISVGVGCSNPEGDNTATCTGITLAYVVDAGDLNDNVNMAGYPNLLGNGELRG